MSEEETPAIERLGPGLDRSFEAIAERRGEPLTLLAGKVPLDLRGTLFRIGPGLNVRAGKRVIHPFDGDGMVSAYRFDAGGVRFDNRYVRTSKFVAEQQAGKWLFRNFALPRRGGPFGNAFRTKIANPANTSIVSHAGRLMALYEAGQPYCIDPLTLETLGSEDDLGVLGGRFFSAHQAIDVDTGDLYNFGPPYRFTGGRAVIGLCSMDGEGKRGKVADITLPRRFYLHDLALTPRYLVLFLNPVHLRLFPFVLGLSAPARAFGGTPGACSTLLLVDRSTLQPRHWIKGPPGFAFHDLNAYEEGDEIVADYCLYDGVPRWFSEAQSTFTSQLLGWGTRSFPTRLRIDVKRGEFVQLALSDLPLEMPRIHPSLGGKPYRFAYGLASLFPRGTTLVKLDVETRSVVTRDFGPGAYPEEAVFVPRAGATREDDGYLLLPVFVAQTERTELWVLNATLPSGEPVARLELPHHVPFTFHGMFSASEIGLATANAR